VTRKRRLKPVNADRSVCSNLTGPEIRRSRHARQRRIAPRVAQPRVTSGGGGARHPKRNPQHQECPANDLGLARRAATRHAAFAWCPNAASYPRSADRCGTMSSARSSAARVVVRCRRRACASRGMTTQHGRLQTHGRLRLEVAAQDPSIPQRRPRLAKDLGRGSGPFFRGQATPVQLIRCIPSTTRRTQRHRLAAPRP